MFLTTEPSLPGKTYIPLRVIFGVGTKTERSDSDHKSVQAWQLVISHALADLQREAVQLGADGVIGVHLSTSETGAYFHAAVMGTAIKFQQP
jgi:Putative heavy-metal-binding